MLSDLANILDRSRITEEEMQSAARLLLRRQFVYHGDHGTGRSYEVIRDHQSYFGGLMEALGYTLFIDARRTVAGVVPHVPGRRIGIEETILLLAMRLTYEKGCQSLSLGVDDEITVDAADVLDEYPRFGKRPMPSLTQMKAMVASFAQLRFVTLAADGTSEGFGMVIRPEIRRVTGSDFMSLVEAFLDVGAAPDEVALVSVDVPAGAVVDGGAVS